MERLSRHPAVKAVRGSGHFIGVDLDDPDRVSRLVGEARKRELVLFWFLSRPEGFRIAPPLTATPEELQWALGQLLASLDAVAER